ncbi:MAG TPA: hypothetical protein VLM38_17615 [Blastocatellia bacterium]|nr:hypothetical protein [Blastocatellia bacterium]
MRAQTLSQAEILQTDVIKTGTVPANSSLIDAAFGSLIFTDQRFITMPGPASTYTPGKQSLSEFFATMSVKY